MTSSTNFVLGTDYNFECRSDGIMLTSSTAQFLLTDRAENVPENIPEEAETLQEEPKAEEE